MISSSQRPLPDNTQHSQETIEPPTPTIKQLQTYDLYLKVTGTGGYIYDYKMFMINELDYVMAFVWIRNFQALRLYRCELSVQNFVIKCLNMQLNSLFQRDTNWSKNGRGEKYKSENVKETGY